MRAKILHLSNSHIPPHVHMCISQTHSLIMSMCLHVTQHKAPCTCISLSSTHRDTKNLLSLPQSIHISHTHTVSLSLSNTLNKGFPVNNLPSIHQQSWQYGEHETWKRINLHVRRPPSMTTRTRAGRKHPAVTPSLSAMGKPLFYTVRSHRAKAPHAQPLNIM